MSLSLVSRARIETETPSTSDEFHIETEGEERRVLIVDDSRLVRSVFFNTLSRHYTCTVAESYDEAVEFLRVFPFDVVIADVLMPGLSGTELLRKIVETYPDTTVIMVSGVDRPRRALDALRLGAFDYLIKPCELPVLELAVERAFEHRDLTKNATRYKAALERRNIDLQNGKAELERLQMQLVQNEKMVALGQIAAGMAHELNNPVAFVHGNLDILKQTTSGIIDLLRFYESAGLPHDVADKAAAIKATIPYLSSVDEIDSMIGDCQDGAERIKDIVQNLRTFSRLDEAAFKKADINSGIDSTIRLLSQYFSSGNIALIRDYGDLPAIDAFGSQINQVWMNLLVNAAQSIGKERGHVRITTSSDDDFVTVTIADSGTGIARQDLSRIFDPFYTTKPVGEGTGLGLSICFGIIERHGGTILATSQLSVGAAFTVRLPIRMEHRKELKETGIAAYENTLTSQEKYSYETQATYC